MSTPEKIEQKENISTTQAGEMFSILFEQKENQQVVAKLFEGLSGLAREQKVQETIKIAKGGLQDLKNNIV